MYSRGPGSQEKPLEAKFCKWLRSVGGEPVKGPSYTNKGIPDRICVLPNGGGTIWVEFKGGTYYQLTPIQQWWKDLLISSDPSRYFLIDTKEDLERLIETCKRLIDNNNTTMV
jgi:hypothetical protein